MAPENMNSAPAMETVKPCLKQKSVCHPSTSTSAERGVKRKAQPAATSCQKSPLQRFLDDLVSCPSRVLDVCRATEDCNVLATTPMSRRSIRIAASDPVSSLCSEMTKEHAFGRIKEVVASHMKKNFKPKLTTETGDVCEVTASMITFGFITGVDVLSLLSTLQQVPRQDFLENAGISFTQMTATSSTKTPSALTVGNTSLKQQDLDTLKGQAWLNDKVIHAYLHLLSLHVNSKWRHHVFILPCFITSLWQRNNYSQWLFPRVAFAKYTWILVPTCVNENHWTLLAANTKSMTVGMLNSLPGYASTATEYHQHWIKYTNSRAKVLNETPTGWSYHNYTVSHQTDGNSCGVFVLMFAEQLLHKLTPCILRQCHVKKFREFALARLIHHAKKGKDLLCDLPYCDISSAPSQKKIMWMQCDNCDRWVHYLCANITKKVPKYICLLCQAMGY